MRERERETRGIEGKPTTEREREERQKDKNIFKREVAQIKVFTLAQCLLVKTDHIKNAALSLEN